MSLEQGKPYEQGLSQQVVVQTTWFTTAQFSEAVASGNLLLILGCSLSLWFQTIGIVLSTEMC